MTASPNLITDPGGVAARLAPIIHRDPNTLANTLSKPGLYAMLARNVAPADADAARALKIPGIYFSDTYQRFLPGNFLASQLIGLTGDTHEGLTGIELERNGALTGTPGRRVEVRDVFGRPIQVLADEEASPGTDVKLTIDPAIQAQTESVLASTREKFGAKSAMAIVMDPRDGSVLAMATVPRFNPNKRATINQELINNRPVTDTFEPGSTFKIVTMAGALEDGRVSPGTAFNLPVEYKLYDRTLKDSHREEPVTYTASEILEQSSNIGTVKIAQRLTQSRLQAWITRFGFGSPTGIDYPGEVKGLVLPRDKWSGTSILNIPIGQGVGVTLTQLTRAYAAIANGGRLVTPHVIDAVGGTPQEHPAGRRIMSAQTARQGRQDAAQGGVRQRHRHRREDQRLPGGGQDRHRRRRSTRRPASTATPSTTRRSWATRPPRTPSCWWRWSWTSPPPAPTTAATWPPRRSRTSPSFPCAR